MQKFLATIGRMWRSGWLGKTVVVVVPLLIVGMIQSALGVSPQQKKDATATALALTPTATPSPTAIVTPSPIPPTPTETPPDVALRQAIETELGELNRDGPKIQDFVMNDTVVTVDWAINDNLTADLAQIGAKEDILNVLRLVRDSGVPYEMVRMRGTIPLGDSFGNSSETTVVFVQYNKATVDKINFDNIDLDNVFKIADASEIHPEFRD